MCFQKHLTIYHTCLRDQFKHVDILMSWSTFFHLKTSRLTWRQPFGSRRARSAAASSRNWLSSWCRPLAVVSIHNRMVPQIATSCANESNKNQQNINKVYSKWMWQTPFFAQSSPSSALEIPELSRLPLSRRRRYSWSRHLKKEGVAGRNIIPNCYE